MYLHIHMSGLKSIYLHQIQVFRLENSPLNKKDITEFFPVKRIKTTLLGILMGDGDLNQAAIKNFPF